MALLFSAVTVNVNIFGNINRFRLKMIFQPFPEFIPITVKAFNVSHILGVCKSYPQKIFGFSTIRIN